MSNVVLSDRTFARGPQRWRIDHAGNWQTLMWGWYPTGISPRWQWHAVEKDQVPDDVLNAAGE